MDNSRNSGKGFWPLYVFVGCFFMGYWGNYYMSINNSEEDFGEFEEIVIENSAPEIPDSSVYDNSYFKIR